MIVRIGPGRHELGPRSGTLRLRTHRQGLVAKAGHDLVLEASNWRGSVVVPEVPGGVSPVDTEVDAEVDAEVDVEVDVRSVHVIEGTGGVKPLTDGDKEEIRRTMQKQLRTADHPTATFRATGVRIDGDGGTLHGELSIAGRSHPVELRVRRDENGAIVGHAEILQSAWGIKPYSGFLGALKLRDAVDVDVSLSLPG